MSQRTRIKMKSEGVFPLPGGIEAARLLVTPAAGEPRIVVDVAETGKALSRAKLKAAALFGSAKSKASRERRGGE